MELDEPFGPVPTFHMPLGNPFSLLDQGFLERAAAVYGEGPHITHPREVRQIDVEVKDNNTPAGSSGHGPVIEDVTGHEFSHGPEIRGTVLIDEDDDDDNLPSAQDTRLPSNPSTSNYSVPRAPPIANVSDYNNDIEEEMVRAAIEASKRDADGLTNVRLLIRYLLLKIWNLHIFFIKTFGTMQGLRSGERENASRGRDDDEIARAVSMSLEVVVEHTKFCFYVFCFLCVMLNSFFFVTI